MKISEGLVLADSGSDEHLCGHGFGAQHPIVQEDPTAPKLTTVSGQALGTEGLRRVPMVVGGDTGRQPCLGNLRVCNDLAAKDAVLSLGKLARRNFRFVLDERDPHALDLTTGTRADMKLVGNSFFFPTEIHDTMAQAKQAVALKRAKVAATGAAGVPLDAPPGAGDEPSPGARGSGDPAPAEGPAPSQGQEPMAPEPAAPALAPGRSYLEGLGPGSRIDALQKRLKEIRQPWYGTKAQCWARLVDNEGKRKVKATTDNYRELRREEMRLQAETGQIVEPATFPAVRQPTEEEQRRHEDNQHCPPQAWCEHCQMGRGRHNPGQAS